MFQRSRGAVTPQQKIIGVTDKFGNPAIKKQQGTTRVIYDTLPLDGRTEFRFFEESNNRNFPFTNMGADGNKLPVGNALACERAYLSVISRNATTGSITNVGSLFAGGGFENITVGELSLIIANKTTLKQMAILSMDPRFNKNAAYDDYNNFEFDTQAVLNPLLEFVYSLRTNTYVPFADTFLRFTIEGVGAIIAPAETV